MKIKDVTEGVLSNIYKATQRNPSAGGTEPDYKYEVPTDLRMDPEMARQARELARSAKKRELQQKAHIDAELEFLKKKAAGTVDPEERKKLAAAFAKVALQQKDLGGLQRPTKSLANGIPAGTEVTAPGGIIITMGKDGVWYDPTGAQIVNLNDIKQLNARAKSTLAARAGMAQTANIPTQIPPVRVEPRKKGRTR